MKLRAFQKTISLTNGDSSAEVDFPSIPGSIVAFSDKLIGSLPSGESADITFKDNGQNINDPIDISVGEVTTKADFLGSLVPMPLNNPGQIKVVITPSATIGSGEDYKVKVMLYYVQGSEAVKPSECI